MEFLKEYWLWILIPFVVVIGGLIVLVLVSGGSTASEFVYPVF